MNIKKVLAEVTHLCRMIAYTHEGEVGVSNRQTANTDGVIKINTSVGRVNRDERFDPYGELPRLVPVGWPVLSCLYSW